MPIVIKDEIRKIIEKAIRLKHKKGSLTSTDLQELADQTLDHSFIQHIRENSYAQDNQDGVLSVSLAHFESKSEAALAVSAGYRDPLNNKETVNSNTLYNISSISKFILMMMSLRLVQAGKLDLHAPISTYFKEEKIPQVDKITLAHLLAHRSGLKDSGFISFMEFDPLDKLIQKNEQGPVLMGKPGENFYYANINFVLAAKIIQSVMGKKLGLCFEELIAKPLNLSGVYVIDEHDPSLAIARGYQPDELDLRLQDGSEQYIFGAKCFRANPSGMVQLMAAFFRDDFIQPALRDEDLKSIQEETFEVITADTVYRWPVKMGLGIEAVDINLDEGEQLRIYCYGGWQNSHASFLVYNPKDDSAYASCFSKTHGLERIHQKSLTQAYSSLFTFPESKQEARLSVMGLGCVDLCPANSAIVDHAIRQRITSLDTADFYGGGVSETTLGQKLKTYPRERLFISTKCGVYFDNGVQVCGTPEYIQAACEASLKRLQTHYIDLYYLHRVDPKTPIETSVGAMAELVKQGKVRNIGLSEVTLDQLKSARNVHPISAVQIEFSPWSRQDEHNGLIAECKRLGITVVAYSPLGRAFFTNQDQAYFKSLPDQDFRKLLPRYNGEKLEHNLRVRTKLEGLAKELGCTLAQLVLAWEIKQGMVVIPGAMQQAHFDENLAALLVRINDTDCKKMESLLESIQFAGPRYPSPAVSAIYSEPSVPKSSAFLTPKNLSLGLSFITLVGGVFAYTKFNKNKAKNPAPSLNIQPTGP